MLISLFYYNKKERKKERKKEFNKMNYWDLLSTDLQNHIREIGVFQNCQRIWRRQTSRAIHAMNIVDKYINSNGSINPMLLSTARDIEYCVKYASRLDKHETIWKSFVEGVERSLWDNSYMRYSGEKFYNRTEIAIDILNNRLIVLNDKK